MVTLHLLDSPDRASLQQWNLENTSVVRIGRAEDNHVVVNNALVSRYHAELRFIQKRDGAKTWQLISRGRNGTFLNGVLISQITITDGSRIQLASQGPILKFSITPGQTTLAVKAPLVANPCQHRQNPPNSLFCIHCGQPLKVQLKIRQYQVLRVLGQGGMGKTYLVWNAVMAGIDNAHAYNAAQPLQVLKEMNANLASIAKARELFEREARILKRLKHSGIPKFFDFFLEGGKKYLAMELIHGQNLETYVAQKGPVSPRQAIAWMINLCEILRYLHHQNPAIIHRDIKPANLLVRQKDHRLVLIDFGAVKEVGTPPGTCIGAEGYTAPEQDLGIPLTQSDLYAIGPTLLFLLTGQHPQAFYGEQNGEHRLITQGLTAVPANLQTVIERVTQPKPVQRYKNVNELARALADCM